MVSRSGGGLVVCTVALRVVVVKVVIKVVQDGGDNGAQCHISMVFFFS